MDSYNIWVHYYSFLIQEDDSRKEDFSNQYYQERPILTLPI